MTAGSQDSNESTTTDTIIQTHLLTMNAVVQGISTGLFVGLGIFAATVWLVLKGGESVGPHLALLGQYFVGYTVTWGGSFIGLAYGFALGYGIGYGYARIYNWVVDKKNSRAKT